MTAAERARRWFQRHAQARYVGETLVAFGVDWSEEVEASLMEELVEYLTDAWEGAARAAAAEAIPVVPPPSELPNHEPWPSRNAASGEYRSRTRTNWIAPGCQTESDVETWP